MTTWDEDKQQRFDAPPGELVQRGRAHDPTADDHDVVTLVHPPPPIPSAPKFGAEIILRRLGILPAVQGPARPKSGRVNSTTAPPGSLRAAIVPP